jgi:hypothetical protein
MSKYDAYHARYDNKAYRALSETIRQDLNLAADSLTLSDIMNAVTDATLHICHPASHADALKTLVRLCHHEGEQPATLRAISQYLERFEEQYDTHSADFENSALTLFHLRQVIMHLAPAISVSSAIHGEVGAYAHYLAVASKLLLDATHEYLLVGNKPHAYEKTQTALQYIHNTFDEPSEA